MVAGIVVTVAVALIAEARMTPEQRVASMSPPSIRSCDVEVVRCPIETRPMS
jgi:hypothetical protein